MPVRPLHPQLLRPQHDMAVSAMEERKKRAVRIGFVVPPVGSKHGLQCLGGSNPVF